MTAGLLPTKDMHFLPARRIGGLSELWSTSTQRHSAPGTTGTSSPGTPGDERWPRKSLRTGLSCPGGRDRVPLTEPGSSTIRNTRMCVHASARRRGASSYFADRILRFLQDSRRRRTARLLARVPTLPRRTGTYFASAGGARYIVIGSACPPCTALDPHLPLRDMFASPRRPDIRGKPTCVVASPCTSMDLTARHRPSNQLSLPRSPPERAQHSAAHAP
jgi:hypothetical protein